MTELNADDWFAAAEGATASTSDDATRKLFGTASVRFDTTGGFDTFLRYEPAAGAIWDLTAADEFRFNVFAQNPSPVGFQQEPIIRFIDVDGDMMEFRYYRNGSPHPLWNDARGRWLAGSIPIKSSAQPATGWRGTARGTPDWSRMRTVELHADTWDAGFTLWFDGVGFNLPVLAGDYNGNQSVDAADYVLWRKTLASTIDLRADGNANGIVDQADYDIWRSQFGATSPATGNGQSATVAVILEDLHPLTANSVAPTAPHPVAVYSSRGPTARRPSGATVWPIAVRDRALLAWLATDHQLPIHRDRNDNDLPTNLNATVTEHTADVDAAFDHFAPLFT
jgi:hypothetical protein